MKRPSKVSGKGPKVRRIAASKSKRAFPQSKESPPNSSAAGTQGEIARLIRELSEALERQAATSEVLKVISSSPGDLEPVFAAMLEKAVRICDAKFGNIYQWDGDALHLIATHNTPPAYAELRRRSPVRFDQMPESMRRMIATGAPVQVGDILTLPDIVEQHNPVAVAGAELGGIRTVL